MNLSTGNKELQKKALGLLAPLNEEITSYFQTCKKVFATEDGSEQGNKLNWDRKLSK